MISSGRSRPVDIDVDIAVLLAPPFTTGNEQLTTPKFCASYGGSS